MPYRAMLRSAQPALQGADWGVVLRPYGWRQAGLTGWLLLGWLLLGSASARATCPARAQDVGAVVLDAERAFAAMDAAGFDHAAERLQVQLGCLSEPLRPPEVALVHRALALAAFRAGDHPGVRAALLAMHETDPALRLPVTLAPVGGPLAHLESEALALPASARIPHGLALNVEVDGRREDSLPADRPAVVVVLGSEGQVHWSGLVPAGDTRMLWAADVHGPAASPAPDRSRDVGPGPGAPRRVLLGAAGGSAVVAVGLGLGAWSAQQQLLEAQSLAAGNASAAEWQDSFGRKLSPTQTLHLKDTAAGLRRGAAAAAGAALGLGVVGVVIRW